MGCCKSKPMVGSEDDNNNTNVSVKLMGSSLDTPDFSISGHIAVCKVVDVYDGDTCKVVFLYNGKLSKWTVRLAGYDTPEMRASKNTPNRELIKARAILARDYLRSLVMADCKYVFIRCGPFEKFGRITGSLYLENPVENAEQKSINRMMIDSGHGVEIEFDNKE